MSINVTEFRLINATDSCAVWNVLSSSRLLHAAIEAKVVFIITDYVRYECLERPRSELRSHDADLMKQLVGLLARRQFHLQSVAVDDLLDPALLKLSVRIGKGELSVIAHAKRMRHALLTDDQLARRLASEANLCEAQTTPHLFGWLLYSRVLVDGDVEPMIAEHKNHKRPLEKYFRKAYEMAMRARCMERNPT